MTREDYVKAILRKTSFDRKTKKRLEADLLSDIAARQDAGEPLPAVMAAMGTPEEVAHSLADAMPGEVAVRKSRWRWVFFGFAMLLLALMLFSMVYWQLFGHLFEGNIPINPPQDAAVGIIGGADGPTAIYTTRVTYFGLTFFGTLGLVAGSLATFLLMQWKGTGPAGAARYVIMAAALLTLAAVLLAGGLSGAMLENLLMEKTFPAVMAMRLVNPAFLWPLITGIVSLRRYLSLRKKSAATV